MKIAFIEPMECLAVSKLPKTVGWLWEIKLDGYRAEAVKSAGHVYLLSRRQKSFNKQFPLIREALAELPNNTVVDGEIVALDESGRPDFNLLQSFRAAAKHMHYLVFDVLMLNGEDLTSLPLIHRRSRMQSLVFSSPLIRFSEQFDTSSEEMSAAVRELGLEGVIGKRKDGKYESGKRTGSWIKHRINRGQELLISGYFPGSTRVRCYHPRLLQGRGLDLCRENEKWICSGLQTTSLFEIEKSR
jgi:bifunctional non-homologous end joining protein LigD